MPDLLDWQYVNDATWQRLVDRAVALGREGAVYRDTMRGKSLGLLFFNPSLRTRCSMELAAVHLGAHPTTLTPGQGTWQFAWDEGAVMDGGEAEHIKEAVGVLSRYYDALGVRLFAGFTDRDADRTDARLHQFARYADVPVVNLESAAFHPCQALADAATITRECGDVQGKRFVLTWAYHPKALPQAVPNSALLMAARLGMHVTVARPEGFALDADVMAQARAYADAHGAAVDETTDPDVAYDGADVVYAKAWAGADVYTDPGAEAAARTQHRDWRVTAERMARTNEGLFMHCLPVRRGVVVDDAVLDGPHARHLLQAEHRLHAQKAILEWVWEK